jgi:hypothetical protein
LVWFDLIQDGHSIQAVFNRRLYAGDDKAFETIAKSFQRGDIVRKCIVLLITPQIIVVLSQLLILIDLLTGFAFHRVDWTCWKDQDRTAERIHHGRIRTSFALFAPHPNTVWPQGPRKAIQE